MNFKALLIILLALSVSACGHLKNKNSHQADDSVVNHSETEELLNDNDLTETLEESTSQTEDAAATPTQRASETIAAEQTKIIHRADVIDRIRDGFSFPDLRTKDVKQHEKWASEHNTYLDNLFGRAEPFLFFIVEEIEKRGLPMELALLPAVESAYNPSAVSRSRAAGLWQFVPNTGRGFNLHQNWWYDGRHDPYSSTFAALDYLEQLHKMFDGDWFIALAAYNAGPGTLRKTIRRAKQRGRKTDYVSLNLRSETRRYIPKLVALKNIINNPEKYGITLPKVANRQYFEVIELPGQINLEEFAEHSGIDLKLLKTMNRGFKRWATAPNGPHRILVPLDAQHSAAYAIAAVEKSQKVSFESHRIQRGDTLSGIARRYGVSVSALRTTNKLASNNIREGRNLLIPVAGHLSPPAAKRPAGEDSQIVHQVKAGETLWSIAKQYKVKLDQLMAWNNLRFNDVLSLNQTLTVFLK